MTTAQAVFATDLGRMKAQWKGDKLCSLLFTEEADESDKLSGSQKKFVQSVQDHLSGKRQDWDKVELDLDACSEFARRVYLEARHTRAGELTSYGEIAKGLQKRGAERAVGTALGKNPILLVIPCHRVLASGGKLGGFSAPGGVATKEQLLALEGVGVESLWDPTQMKAAHQHLLACPKLGPVVEAVGEPTLEPLYPGSPFGALARAILYQQLATSAARAIETRVKKLGSAPFPSALEIVDLTEAELRNAGVSGPKIATLKRLAEATVSGSLQPDKLHLLPNTEVEARVSSLKGLGTWSARIFLLFHLGRRDLLPVKDLGIRKGFQKVYGDKTLPEAKLMERRAKRWAPYRSLASWYLWRSLELPS